MASYLSGILKSISKDDSRNQLPVPKASPLSRSSTSGGTGVGVKRKAESDLQGPESKSQRTGDVKISRDIKPLPQRQVQNGQLTSRPTSSYSNAPRPAATNGIRNDKASSKVTPKTPVPSRPSSNPRPAPTQATSARPNPVTDTKKPVQPSRTGTVVPTSNVPVPAKAVSTQAQPKKGSFKDIMARAKAAKTVAVGKITHRTATEKITKKDRIALAKGKPPRGKDAAALAAVKPANPASKPKAGGERDPKPQKGAVGANASKYQGTSKPKALSKPAYSGTAKPISKPAYKGTSKTNAVPTSRGPAKPQRRAERNEYLGTDEEDEGEYGYDSDEQYYENSDDYSDMDAGFDEIGDEEAEAERQAKRDDVKEQKLLDKLAREKAEKKRGR